VHSAARFQCPRRDLSWPLVELPGSLLTDRTRRDNKRVLSEELEDGFFVVFEET